MNVKKEMTFDELVEKVGRQEEIITQLIKIVAATNHRISDLSIKEEKLKQTEFVN